MGRGRRAAVIEFCSDKWVEAARAADLPFDLKTGKKMAFNEVLQYARKLLSEAS